MTYAIRPFGARGARRPSHPAIPRLRVFTESHLDRIPQLRRLPEEQRRAIEAVASVLPFRVNQYVLDELIRWDRVPFDPIFQLTFPQPHMLATADYECMRAAFERGVPREQIEWLARGIRRRLNPHPAGQQELNVPTLDGEPVEGMQHKYRETVLFFPSQGQTCHAYCSFCFRWAQFVGDRGLRFASREVETLQRYLRRHREVTDLLVTGGDPMVMRSPHLAGILEPLLDPGLEHVRTVRIGTKSLSFWPRRFVTDDDADEVLRLFERLVRGGKHVAVMAHFNHWRELETDLAREAVRRVRDTGAVIRSQGPLLAHINDNPEIWARLWRTQAELGIVPYYMFVGRDTGSCRYFEVPLVRAWRIYRDALQRVSGIARTARGPSMSATPGKVEVQGVTEIQGEKVLALRFLQGRNPDWVQRPFFARYDERATWLDQLEPAFGEERFFFEEELEAMCRGEALGRAASTG